MMQMLECAISAEMVEDVKGRESAAKGTLESKRSRLAKLGADRQLQELAANLRQTASRISTLRQAAHTPPGPRLCPASLLQL